ncbi:MAG: hypothetical protein ACLQNG_16775 [Acidimicrobiales bacterium]
MTTNTVELDDLEIRILEAMMFSTEPLPELKELLTSEPRRRKLRVAAGLPAIPDYE